MEEVKRLRLDRADDLPMHQLTPAEKGVSLPSLSEPFEPPSGASDRYREDGFYVVRGLATPEEVAPFREPIIETTRRMNTETRPMEERDTYAKAFLQTMNLWKHDETVRRFVMARRFAGLAAALMGVPAVRLYHDQSLFKEPNGGHTPWHQDQYYWPLDTDATITMWMPLVDATEEMGVMHFARGSHREGYLEELPIGDESEERLSRFVAERGYEVAGPGTMRAGDATFHSGWTLHHAAPNRSGRMREVMTVIYFADGARVIEPDNFFRAHDLLTWLPGAKPGDLAATENNPLLYP